MTFSTGQTTKTISIRVYGDRTAELDETVLINLTAPSGATIADSQGVVTIINDDGNPLVASSAPTAGTTTALTEALLEVVAELAKRAWIASQPGIDLSGLTVSIAELDGLLLGVTGFDAVTIDATAAGWGWNLTPNAAEFTGIDLYSVLLHEFGHVLGFEHTDTGLMAGTIEPGVTLSLEFHPSTVATPVGAAATAVDLVTERAHDVMQTSAGTLHSAVPAIASIDGLTVGGTADRAAEATRAALDMTVRPMRVALSVASSADSTLHAVVDPRRGTSGAPLSPMTVQLSVALIAIAFLGRRRLA